MNKVILMGRLTRDPEVRYSQGENATAVARFTLAVDRRFRRDDASTDFIGCVAFGRNAEFIEKYFRQGTKALITGRIQTGSYTNRDGQKVYTTDIIVEDQEFADSKGQGGDNGTFGGNSYGGGNTFGGNTFGGGSTFGGNRGGYQQATRPAPSSAIGDGFMNIPDGVEDEGLPFN